MKHTKEQPFNRIKERRMELGLTQPQVSEHLKRVDLRMDVGMVSRFETGTCIPTPDVLDALCDVLQASKSYLYGEEEVFHEDECEEIPEEVQAIKQAIPHGRRNAISRETLSRRLCTSDREARKRIETARRYGVMIINSGTGYYQTDNIEEIERQYRQDRKRALAILSRLKSMRTRLKEVGRAV